MTFFLLYARTPFLLNIVAGPTVSYIAILMNIVIFVVLFNKNIKSPSSVLMQGLAVADSLTAFCTYGMEPLFSIFYEEIGNKAATDKLPKHPVFDGSVFNYGHYYNIIAELKSLLGMRYPYCILHYIMSHLADNFHMVSILLTTSLGLQKLVAVTCPMWSHFKVNIKTSVLVCFTCFFVPIIINVPRMFVISFNSTKDDTCVMSEPHAITEMYVLHIYPILYASVLICSILAMLVSTCCIIMTLCNRKRIRGHTLLSKAEKKSCTLIVCVVVVFLISEAPRLYLNTVIFQTYKSGLNDQNIVKQMVGTQISRQSLECFHEIGERAKNTAFKEGIQAVELCNIIQLFPDRLPIVIDNIAKYVLNEFLSDTMKKIRSDYKSLIEKLGEYLFEQLSRSISESSEVEIFIKSTNKTEETCKRFVQLILGLWDCHTPVLESTVPFLSLGSTPYSEAMNYILNIVWGQKTISLKNLKIFLEIIKILTVLACASNFIIYVIMSEKLQNALSLKLKYLKLWSKK